MNPVAFSDLFDENPSPENQPTQNSQSWGVWSTTMAAGKTIIAAGAKTIAKKLVPRQILPQIGIDTPDSIFNEPRVSFPPLQKWFSPF